MSLTVTILTTKKDRPPALVMSFSFAHMARKSYSTDLHTRATTLSNSHTPQHTETGKLNIKATNQLTQEHNRQLVGWGKGVTGFSAQSTSWVTQAQSQLNIPRWRSEDTQRERRSRSRKRERKKRKKERRKWRKRCQDTALHIPAIDIFTAEQEPQLGVDLTQEQAGLWHTAINTEPESFVTERDRWVGGFRPDWWHTAINRESYFL